MNKTKALAVIITVLLVLTFNPLFTLVEEVKAADTSYYIKNGGNDGNSGLDDANAWATIGKVNSALDDSTISVSDNIYFKYGDTFNDAYLDTELGGTSDDWMTIGAYPPENSSDGNPVFSYDSNPDHNFPQIRLYSDLDYLIIENINFSSTDWHYIYMDESRNINYLTIKNCNFANPISGDEYLGQGIHLRSGNHVTIENCIFDDMDAQGIGIGGVTSTAEYQTRNTTIRNCTMSYCRDGISFHYDADGGPDTSKSLGPNHWVENCTIIDWDASESGIDCSGGDDFENVFIQNCEIKDGDNNGGIWIEWGSHKIVIDDCYIHDFNFAGIGITVSDDVIIRKCIIDAQSMDQNKGGFTTQDTATSETTNVSMYHNTYIVNPYRAIRIMDTDDIGFDIKNNIFYSTGTTTPTYLVTIGNSLSGADTIWANNMWWTQNGATGNHWYYSSGANNFATWSGESEVSGDLQDDPEFGDVGNDNFTLNSTSPCIDAGTWLTQTDGSGTSSWVTVDEANYFFEGISTLGVDGDNIFVGADIDLMITEINYTNNSFKVNRSINWGDDENVSLSDYNGSSPDIGAIESAELGEDGFSGSDAWNIINLTYVTILNLTVNGDLYLTGSLHETASQPANDVVNISGCFWLTADGNLYITGTETTVSTPIYSKKNNTGIVIFKISSGGDLNISGTLYENIP